MREPGVASVLAALARARGSSRFVGGCVRDALIGMEVSDVDIATTHTPDRVIKLLEQAGLRAEPTGIEHGTVTAIANHKPYEITTLRRDVSTDGRRAVVAFTTDWREDALRRDFTINALYADPDGTLYDPTGGIADLEARRVRFIGEAGQRIAEDYLRVLRFFRFHAWYGRGAMDAEGLAACAGAKGKLAVLSGERVQKEFLKLLAANAPIESLREMEKTGVLEAILPGPWEFARLASVVAIETGQLMSCDPVLRLGALIASPEQASAAAERLRLSTRDRTRIEALQAEDMAVMFDLSVREVRKLLYRVGAGRFRDFVLLRWAEAGPTENAAAWRSLIALAECWTRPEFPVSGHDAMAAGIPSGPELGRALNDLEEWWIEQDFAPDKAALLARLEGARR